jgi:hypothetical protein
MAIPIALAAISLLAAAASAGLVVVVSVAVRKEDRNLTLTSQAPGHLTRMGRRLTGVHVLRPAPRHSS